MKKKICIFGGSSSGIKKEHEKLAITLGQIIAENNFDIVYGGGDGGGLPSIDQSEPLLSRFWWGSCENGCTHMCD